MRVVLLPFCLAFVGCAAKVNALGAPRPDIARALLLRDYR